MVKMTSSSTCGRFNGSITIPTVRTATGRVVGQVGLSGAGGCNVSEGWE